MLGTHVIALAAQANTVGKFVTISTDKAVNRTNVIGATKRLVQMALTDSHDEVAVKQQLKHWVREYQPESGRA